MMIVKDLLLFLFTGATLSLLLWTAFELFRTQEDPLSDRLEGLQSQAMVVAARATRRKKSAQGLDLRVARAATTIACDCNPSKRSLNGSSCARKSSKAVHKSKLSVAPVNRKRSRSFTIITSSSSYLDVCQFADH